LLIRTRRMSRQRSKALNVAPTNTNPELQGRSMMPSSSPAGELTAGDLFSAADNPLGTPLLDRRSSPSDCAILKSLL